MPESDPGCQRSRHVRPSRCPDCVQVQRVQALLLAVLPRTWPMSLTSSAAPSGQTCYQWAGEFTDYMGGYLNNPNATEAASSASIE